MKYSVSVNVMTRHIRPRNGSFTLWSVRFWTSWRSVLLRWCQPLSKVLWRLYEPSLDVQFNGPPIQLLPLKATVEQIQRVMATKDKRSFFASCNSVPQPANRIQLTIPLLRWCRIAMVMHETVQALAVYISCDTSTPPKTAAKCLKAIIEICIFQHNAFGTLLGPYRLRIIGKSPGSTIRDPGRKARQSRVPIPKAYFLNALR